MSGCKIKIEGIEEKFNCDYRIDDELIAEIYNCPINSDRTSQIKYKEMTILDLKGSKFYYSPLFYYAGETYSLVNYNKYRTNFYLYTSNVENLEDLDKNLKIKTITIYNPMLIHYFTCSSLCAKYDKEKEKLNYTVILKNADKKEIFINKNNIEKIELSSTVSCRDKHSSQLINIETQNFIKLYLLEPINYDELLGYINEIDVFINAYFPTGNKSYKTIIQTENNKYFEVYHKLLGKEKYYDNVIYNPIKLNFFEYIEKMYKEIDYRNAENRNKYLPLDFKNPITLEEQFTYYIRYIDMYIGNKYQQPNGHKPKTHMRFKYFLDEYGYLFEKQDIQDINKLKNEINSLRAQYVHEGYYLPNNQFQVESDDKTTYYKDMDYNWLYRITKALKLSVYTILYKEVLGLEIDEKELKYALND